jgi:hypothetical protein
MKQTKVMINGSEYTLQKLLPREWLRLRERCKNKSGQPVEEKLYDELLEHIVVSPKKHLDDFEDMAELEELMAEAVRFQLGRDIEL